MIFHATRFGPLSCMKQAHSLPRAGCFAVCAQFPMRPLSSLVFLLTLAFGLASQGARAQELEVRRWSHLPTDESFLILSYAHTSGKIGVDDVYEIEDAKVELDSWNLAYLHIFEMLGKTARVDLRQAYQVGTWSGRLSGTERSVERSGFNDLNLRFALNLFGAPPLSGAAFASYRAAQKQETIVGIAVNLQLPTGQYIDDKVINLGASRLAFRPQLGFQYKDGKWVFELTGSAAFFTTNQNFNGGQTLAQKPFYAFDGSIEYLFDQGVWLSAGFSLSMGGRTALNGVVRDDERRALAWIVSAGMPVTDDLALRATYLGTENLAETGLSSHSFGLSLQTHW